MDANEKGERPGNYMPLFLARSFFLVHTFICPGAGIPQTTEILEQAVGHS